MTKAVLIFKRKRVFPDGAVAELKLWHLPPGRRVPGSAHPYKYSLFYGRAGMRLLAYDNEAGKGDHVHRGAAQEPYRFTSVDALVRDFLDGVRRLRGS